MSSGLTIDTEVIGGDIPAVTLRGSLDSVGTPECECVVSEHIEKGHSRIIVDCRYLDHLSSSGIGTLVALQTPLHRRRASVKLSTLSSPVAGIGRDSTAGCFHKATIQTA